MSTKIGATTAKKKTGAAKKQKPQEQEEQRKVKKQEETKQVAKKEKAAPPSTNVMEILFEDRGAGMGQFQVDDLAIPFLAIVQDGSPQANPKKEKYIEGAEAGHIFNTVNGDLYESVTVIPIHYSKVVIEWRDRDEGGGFVAVHEKNSQAVKNAELDNKGVLRSPNGNPMVETAQFYILLVDEDSDILSRSIIAMKSTQLKKARKWNTIASEIKMRNPGNNQLFTPPLYSHIYELGTKYEDNDKGDWYGWTIDLVGPIENMEILEQARVYYQSIQEGTEIVNYEKSDLNPDQTTVEDQDDDESDEDDGEPLY